MWSHPLLLPTPGASRHRGDLQEPGDLSRRGDAWNERKGFFFFIYISCDVCVRCCVLCLGSLPFCVQLVLLCVGCVDFYGVALLPYLCVWSW